MQGWYYRSIGFLVLSCFAFGCATPPAAAPATPPPTSATAGTTTIVAIAPPAPTGPTGTIWDFLGVKTLCNDICMVTSGLFNLFESQFPSLAAGLPNASMFSPMSPTSSNPAVAAAASAKADASSAPQKAAALKYLGTLGCGGCYPEVEKALLAGLDDCTEMVRFEAASALAETGRTRCRYCDSNRCCSANVRNKLISIATETGDNGCYLEPSGRVRRMARVALCNCAGDPFELEPQQLPAEGPSTAGTVPPRPQSMTSRIGNADAKSEAPRSAYVASSAAPELRPNEKLEKPSDIAPKPSDYVKKASDTDSKQAYPAVKTESTQSSVAEGSRDQSQPRIRWERAAVSIYRFETREEAISAMDYVRKKALGETPETPASINLQYVTTREVGWTRRQDVRSPELAKLLFELPVGQISPVIQVGDTLLVCRILEKEQPSSPEE